MSEPFDDLTRILASHMPRRQVIKLALGAVSSYAVGFFWPRSAQAQNACTNVCVINGAVCGGGLCCPPITVCCVEGNTCLCCKSRQKCCAGPVCCPACQECTNGKCVPCNSDPCRICRNDGECIPACPNPGGDDPRTMCCVNKKTNKFVSCCNPASQCCADDGTCKAKPKANIGNCRSGPPAQVDITITAEEVGIGAISIIKLINATLDIPNFQPGTPGPVTVTATKIDQSQRAGFWLTVSPPASCGCETCGIVVDPVVTQLQIPPGKSWVEQTFTEVPAAERFVTIQNGGPGMRRIAVIVNGKRVANLWLHRRETHTFAIPSEKMNPQNVVTVVAEGRPHANALFLVSDIPGVASALNAAAFLPPVAWEPGSWQPGQDLSWGM